MKKVKFNFKKITLPLRPRKKAIHEDLDHAVDQENKEVSGKKQETKISKPISTKQKRFKITSNFNFNLNLPPVLFVVRSQLLQLTDDC